MVLVETPGLIDNLTKFFIENISFVRNSSKNPVEAYMYSIATEFKEKEHEF